MITCRDLREADLPACMEIHHSSLGDEIVGRETALRIWKQLLRSPAFLAGVIEADSPANSFTNRRHLLGFGSSVFVSQEFVDRELVNPRPCINSRIIASVASGESVVLDYDQVARANAGPGLNAVFLSTPWWKTSCPEEFAEMMTVSGVTCAEAHAGYRLRSALVDLSGEQTRAVMSVVSGGWRLIREFGETGRALVMLTRKASLTTVGSIVNVLFHFEEPVLDLHPTDQELLLAALKGATDDELAPRLSLSVSAVKKRWLAMFARVEELRPDLFVDLKAASEGKRGPQKRHRVLGYVREHPEELRPYSRAAAAEPGPGLPRLGLARSSASSRRTTLKASTLSADQT